MTDTTNMSNEDKSTIVKHTFSVAWTRCFDWKKGGVQEGMEGLETSYEVTKHVPTKGEFLTYIQFDEEGDPNPYAHLADSSDIDDARDFLNDPSHARITWKIHFNTYDAYPGKKLDDLFDMKQRVCEAIIACDPPGGNNFKLPHRSAKKDVWSWNLAP